MKNGFINGAAVLAGALAFIAWGGSGAHGAPAAGAAREQVLFPFDDQSLPFNSGLVLTLVQGRKVARTDPELTDRPVLAIGAPGEPDYPRLAFYGTVLRVDGQYRMWYTGDDEHAHGRRVCYATSPDGTHWTKPKLGLVDYHGSKENNLVAIDGDQPAQGLCALVLDEPEDPNPDRRFKMLREIAVPGASWPVYAAVSADGIRWRSVGGNQPINPNFQIEPTGLIKFHGAYYLNGHSSAIRHPVPGAHKRTMQTFVSYDFEHWTSAAVLSFRRDNIPPRPILDFEGHRGEQVHVGAALWNRGNVVLGFYGQWHNATNDRRDSVIDLGLIVSNNAMNFREPIPDFKIIPAAEEPDQAEARLIQGEGFENIGNRTIVYYGVWTAANKHGPTGVRIATWPRDQLGYYSPSPGVTTAQCLSAPLAVAGGQARVFVNAAGLSADSGLRVEILDEQFRPLAGYAADDCTPLQSSGLRLPVAWRGKNAIEAGSGPIRVRISWVGSRLLEAKLFAIYVE